MSILYWISTSRCSRSATNSKEEGEEGNGVEDGHESDKNIEIWKIKKLIKALESARGNGTSMISLIMPPGDESGTASNIKSTVNGQSVLGAIRSTQRRIKLYNKVPPSGLVLYTRTIITADGRLPYCQTPFPSSPLLSHSREGRGCHHTNQSLFTLELHGIIIIPRAASSAVSKLTRCSFLLLKGLLICAVQGPRSSFSSLPCTYCSSKCSYISKFLIIVQY